MLSPLAPRDADGLLFDWDGTLVDSQGANYRAMAEALDLPIPVREIVARCDEHFLRQAHRVRAHPAVLEIVRTYHGRLPMAVASGGSRTVISRTMRHLPYASLFSTVVTREDVERGKPAPDIFLLAAHRLGIAPERCAVYEDSDEGVAAALAAGMTVIDVRSHTGRWPAGSRSRAGPMARPARLVRTCPPLRPLRTGPGGVVAGG
ncbi:HAD family hydrolase [Nonomuraea rhodomycinica]|uniref:HAD family phosphatase n=1 Tax=Nonomuraea rhodomycinica TaxID=1712872 RepID=A0A7Y6M9W1_9ACTN|nr:HAD family phosphatase [Nonomuraea rhodomycinica]NUW38824.1 HAD family phosphatase [Nonomuraea rhodomycinica]